MSGHIRNGFSAVRPYVFGPHSILDLVEGSLNGKVLARHHQAGNCLLYTSDAADESSSV